MQTFIEFFFGNLENIIMALALLALGISGFYLIYKVFFYTEPTSNMSTEHLEEALKKVLAQVETIGNTKSFNPTDSSAASPSVGSAAVTPGNDQKWIQLQDDLKSKQKEIEKLTHELKNKDKSDNSSEDLLNKIKELEARLAEYEIIEDDIADLSKYKEENVKLKKQVEKLKAGQSAAEDTELSEDANSEIQEVNAPDGSSEVKNINTAQNLGDSLDLASETSQEDDDVITEDLINEFEQAVNEQLGLDSKKVSARKEIEVGEEIEVEDTAIQFSETEAPVIVDTQAEVDSLFEKAEAELKEQTQKTATSKQVHSEDIKVEKIQSSMSTQSSQVATAETENRKEPEGADDIFGEFVSNDSDASLLSEELDTDRMIEEISTLGETDGSVSTQLEDNFDVERMAAEAQNLQKN